MGVKAVAQQFLDEIIAELAQGNFRNIVGDMFVGASSADVAGSCLKSSVAGLISQVQAFPEITIDVLSTSTAQLCVC